jgi:hypothetical protein
VRTYPGPGAKFQISTDGGTQPAWAKNGRELFYTTGPVANTKMMAVRVTFTPTFSATSPSVLFEGRYGTTTPVRGYDVSADGQRFLMIQPKDQRLLQLPTQMVVVLNWFQELKRRAAGT